MEKEEKLDEILNAKKGEVQSNISNIYKMTRFLLNKNIGEGKGKITDREDGRIEYSLVIDTDKYQFGFIYSNFNHPHLQISAAKKSSEPNEWGGVSEGYIVQNSYVFDVIEQTDKNLYVKRDLSGKNGPGYIDKWEEALMELINERPTTKDGKLSFSPNPALADNPYDFSPFHFHSRK